TETDKYMILLVYFITLSLSKRPGLWHRCLGMAAAMIHDLKSMLRVTVLISMENPQTSCALWQRYHTRLAIVVHRNIGQHRFRDLDALLPLGTALRIHLHVHGY